MTDWLEATKQGFKGAVQDYFDYAFPPTATYRHIKEAARTGQDIIPGFSKIYDPAVAAIKAKFGDTFQNLKDRWNEGGNRIADDIIASVSDPNITRDNRLGSADNVVLNENIIRDTIDNGYGPQNPIVPIKENQLPIEIFRPSAGDIKQAPVDTSYIDKFENEINNLPKLEYGDRPTREYAALPDLTDRRNYYENFRYNPKQAARDWGNETPFTTTAQFNPFFKMGVEFADMMANPFRQTYFEDLENQNLAEDARRLQQERLDDIAKDKEETRRALDAKRYEYQQDINDTKYSDKIGDLQYKNAQSKDARENALENLKLNKALYDEKQKLKKSAEEHQRIKSSLTQYVPNEDQTLFISEGDKAELNALTRQYKKMLDDSDSIERSASIISEYATKARQLVANSQVLPVPSQMLIASMKNNSEPLKARNIIVAGVKNALSVPAHVLREFGIVEDAVGNYILNNEYEKSISKIVKSLPINFKARLATAEDFNVPKLFRNMLSNNNISTNKFVIIYDNSGNPVNAFGFNNYTKDVIDFNGEDFQKIVSKAKEASLNNYLQGAVTGG